MMLSQKETSKEDCGGGAHTYRGAFISEIFRQKGWSLPPGERIGKKPARNEDE